MVTRLVGESGLLYDHNISDFRFCNVKVEAILLLLLPEEYSLLVPTVTKYDNRMNSIQTNI
jgi:hypothetical protein